MRGSSVISVVLILGFGLCNFIPDAAGLHPIILVPGDGGNQMDARLDKPAVVHYICDRKTKDFFNIWLNLELLVPVVIDCWVDNVRLVYNMTTRKTQNSPGVEIRVPGFGNTTTVEYLDPSKASPGVYFRAIVELSLIPNGYTRNADVRGAPYDFRKAPNEMHNWLADMKQLVEDSYQENGQKSVIFIAHSMGAPLSLYFLSQQSQSWKNKYIRALVSLAGAWGGSVKALKVFAAGDDLGAYLLPAHTLRGYQMTSPSTAWLLPSKHFWKDNDILAEITGKGNITVNNFKDFFDTMDYPVGYEMYKDTVNLLSDFPHPGVEVHCLYGSGVSTVERMNFKDVTYFPDKPEIVNGNGDGTVNLRSLRGCLEWAGKEAQDMKMKKGFSRKKMKKHSYLRSKARKTHKVFNEEFPGVDHMSILANADVLAYIKQTVGSINYEDSLMK